MEAQERIDKALETIKMQLTDGEKHKMWLIDQVVRVLTGCPEVEKTVPYKEFERTVTVLGESEAYREFVRDFEDGEYGPETYKWGTGVAP